MEQLDYNLFVSLVRGTVAGRSGWTRPPSPRTGAAAERRCVHEVHDQASDHSQVKSLLSDEHFSVDGTLIEAWASQKSFRPRTAAATMMMAPNFHGRSARNDTHASTSDPDSRIYRKAADERAKLCYMGHATMENRAWAGGGRQGHACNGTAERRASETC